MTSRKFFFFVMMALILGMTVFSPQRTLAAPAAIVFDDDDDDDDDDNDGPTILVDNDRLQCPNAPFTSIQAAVTAAPPGATILVCPGAYPEQVRINKRLTIRGIRVGNENLATIIPPIALANTASFSGTPIAAIVLVEKTTSVTLDNLTVDGAANLIGGCAPSLVGIYYRNASGKVVNAAVKNIRLFPDALLGCQGGLAIYAQSGTEPGVQRGTKLEVSNSSIHDYQKNGITANELGTELTAIGNAITGLGPTPAIAQNGIQIGFGAKGRVESNAVINHVYSLCVDVTTCTAASTNVLTFDTSNVKILRNTLGKAQVNVYLDGNNNEAAGNTILDTDVFDGVFILGDNNRVTSNSIFNSDEASVFILGNNNQVSGNTFNEAPVGVFNDGSGNNISDNRYFNIEQRVLTPATLANALMRSQQNTSKAAKINPARP